MSTTIEIDNFINLLKSCSSNNRVNDENLQKAAIFIQQNTAAQRLLPIFLEKAKNISFNTKELSKKTLQIRAQVDKGKLFLRSLIPELEEKKIHIIVLKGQAFNGTIYKESAPRGSLDVDILVKSTDYKNLQYILNKFSTKIKENNNNPLFELYEYSWKSNGKNFIYIDVHTALTNPYIYTNKIDELFTQSQPHPIYRSDYIRILSNEHSIIHLATHVINDTNYFHYNLLDCNELLLKPFDLTLAFKFSRTINASTNLYFLLKLVSHIFEHKELEKELSRYQPNIIKLILGNFLIYKLYPIPTENKSILHRIKLGCSYCILNDSPINGLCFNIRFSLMSLRNFYFRFLDSLKR
jgi:hypothetical protein